MGLSIVDSIDTMYLMGLMDEYNEARDWIVTKLDFSKLVSKSAERGGEGKERGGCQERERGTHSNENVFRQMTYQRSRLQLESWVDSSASTNLQMTKYSWRKQRRLATR